MTRPACAGQQLVQNERSWARVPEINNTCPAQVVILGESALYSQPYNLLFQCKSNISTVKLKWVKKCDQARVRRTTTCTKLKIMG